MDLPWPTITAASGGWLLFGALAWLVLRSLLKGTLVTRREADGLLVRAEKAEANVEKLIAAQAAQTGVGKLQRKVLEAAADSAPEDGP